MLFAVILRNRPGQAELGALHRDQHIRWLDEHKDVVRVAGSLRETYDATPVGGLWVVEAPSKEAVLALLVTDPYFTCGLRQSHEVLHWRKAFPSRQVAV